MKMRTRIISLRCKRTRTKINDNDNDNDNFINKRNKRAQKWKDTKYQKNTMTNMEINIGLQVTKQTPVNKGDFKQLTNLSFSRRFNLYCR